MRTRRSYFPITTNVTIPRRQRKQNSNIVEPEIQTIVEMADNRSMAQILQALIEGYEDAIVLDTFYNALNPNDQDALDSAAGSRSRVTDSRVSTNAPLPSSSSPSYSFDLQQIAASLEDKLDIRMNCFEKSLNDMKAFVTSTAPIKACMRTRRSYFPITTNVTIPRRRRRKQFSNIVEPEFRTMANNQVFDDRTMAQMLQAPIEGYEDAIVVPPINANNFELKQTLINLVQSNQFTGRQDHHNHLRFFNKVTSTFRHPEVPNTTIKLLLFPFSLEDEARTWLDKEPPRSILTWEELVSKFINQFFPPSKTTYLRNEIINFLQKLNETINEAWERFKDMLRQCPHHGFSELHQLDTFYNALNPNDQDALDSAAGGNFLDKIPQECLSIIESKSKVRYSRSCVTDSRVSTNAPLPSSSPSHSFDL
nr:reverse transcriptase domain-containing protein [Tanacetum cinerariifolium]